MRLGFSIRIYGSPDLPSHAPRLPGQATHPSLGLAYLRDILLYLRANDIHMYRLHSALAPRHAEELGDCAGQLAELRALIAADDVRLSFHPYSAVVLNALDETQLSRSLAALRAHVSLLDALKLDDEAVVTVHVGGVYDDPVRSRERFVQRYLALAEPLRRRLALEQDDHRFSFADVRWIHAQCGVPLVFDALHHDAHNPEGISAQEALAYCLNTWPAGVRPKVHYASPRTELRGLGPALTQPGAHVKLPTWTEHADCVNPFEFIRFMAWAGSLGPFDVMLEAKARDLALLKLRQDLRRFAPELAAQPQ